jgi:hypothetical protein
LINPGIDARGWKEDNIKRAGAIDIIENQPSPARGRRPKTNLALLRRFMAHCYTTRSAGKNATLR